MSSYTLPEFLMPTPTTQLPSPEIFALRQSVRNRTRPIFHLIIQRNIDDARRQVDLIGEDARRAPKSTQRDVYNTVYFVLRAAVTAFDTKSGPSQEEDVQLFCGLAFQSVDKIQDDTLRMMLKECTVRICIRRLFQVAPQRPQEQNAPTAPPDADQLAGLVKSMKLNEGDRVDASANADNGAEASLDAKLAELMGGCKI